MAHKCIIAMVKPNLTDQVVDSAKAAGATGATIIPAWEPAPGQNVFRTQSRHTYRDRSFSVHETIVEAILSAIKAAGRFSEPGTGIAMVMPIEQTASMEIKFT